MSGIHRGMCRVVGLSTTVFRDDGGLLVTEVTVPTRDGRTSSIFVG
ncbi:MAG: hypothetical protein U0P48_12945 [Ancrocorticia sp.]